MYAQGQRGAADGDKETGCGLRDGEERERGGRDTGMDSPGSSVFGGSIEVILPDYRRMVRGHREVCALHVSI